MRRLTVICLGLLLVTSCTQDGELSRDYVDEYYAKWVMRCNNLDEHYDLVSVSIEWPQAKPGMRYWVNDRFGETFIVRSLQDTEHCLPQEGGYICHEDLYVGGYTVANQSDRESFCLNSEGAVVGLQ